MTSNPNYYEAHITVTPTSFCTFAAFQQYATERHWKASTFEVDDVDGDTGNWFLSLRDDAQDGIAYSVEKMLRTLAVDGFTITRWKIERTVLDSKAGSTLAQLGDLIYD